MKQKFTVTIKSSTKYSADDIESCIGSAVNLFIPNNGEVKVSPAEPSYTEVADWLGNDCVSTKLILDHYKQEHQ